MAKNRHTVDGKPIDQKREIVDKIMDGIIAAIAPFAVAMARKIGSDDMEAIAERARDPVPGTAMIATAMEQDQRRRAVVPPVRVMKLQSARAVEMRSGRAGHGFEHTHFARAIFPPPCFWSVRPKRDIARPSHAATVRAC